MRDIDHIADTATGFHFHNVPAQVTAGEALIFGGKALTLGASGDIGIDLAELLISSQQSLFAALGEGSLFVFPSIILCPFPNGVFRHTEPPGNFFERPMLIKEFEPCQLTLLPAGSLCAAFGGLFIHLTATKSVCM